MSNFTIRQSLSPSSSQFAEEQKESYSELRALADAMAAEELPSEVPDDSQVAPETEVDDDCVVVPSALPLEPSASSRGEDSSPPTSSEQQKLAVLDLLHVVKLKMGNSQKPFISI